MLPGRLSSSPQTLHRIKFIEGLRTVMAFVVLFHHVDLINPRINRAPNVVWKIDADTQSAPLKMHSEHEQDDNVQIFMDKMEAMRAEYAHNDFDDDSNVKLQQQRRRLLSDKGRPKYGTLTMFGRMAAVFDVTIFCLVAGFVHALFAFKCFHSDDGEIRCCNHPFWVYKYMRLIIRRSLKMISSLCVVQLLTFVLFRMGALKLRGSEKFNALQYYQWSNFWFLEFHAFFYSEINGALWICDLFFWSPFACFIVLCITINLESIKHRLCVYATLCALFVNSYYMPVLAGIAAADIEYHGYYVVLFGPHKWKHYLAATCCVSVLFFKLPSWSQADHTNMLFGDVLVVKCIAWFNAAMFCCHYHTQFWLTQWLACDVLAYCGRYTFALYIWHMIVYRVVAATVTPLLVNLHEAKLRHITLADFLAVGVGVICACAFAVAFHELFERPFNTHVTTPLLDKYHALQQNSTNETVKKM